ncbi:hypothetical protein KIF53_22510 [Chromobacterium subtsugae]|uniref:DUF4189 domain-containing protein n=1 Tax=Chromobacterium subtsugae TaxID=251747 RepID=A0ABS7FLR6_9NEIS|nr:MULTISPECIES: hypothetical protein [Chromobacterium]MBW7569257.1 hypothetical protein [Chromobacterium subtsugae]MBW8290410.1 hypothetical protein [Chromobacterium subtsugae]WSE90327.1 hypothetical protein U6115_15710 [Chromobacterium subtsugae]WVH58699.1 hypothetical protein U6151_15735 [Chromobacterium subtsugae]
MAGFFAAACLSGCVIGNTDGYRDAAQLQKTADQALKTCGAGKVKSVSAGSFACVAAGEQN